MATAQSRDEEKHTKNTFVIALARGLDILHCFDSNQPELNTAELTKLTGLPQSTVWRLCNTLVEKGCLVRRQNSDSLSVGAGLLAYGYAALPSLDLGQIVEMEMKRLADELRASVSLSIPDEYEMLFIKRVQGENSLLSSGRVGSHVLLVNSAAGWAYLAALPENELENLMPILKRQGASDWPKLKKNIEREIFRYKEKGFVINAGFYRSEINYVAVPIRANDKIYTLHCGSLASALPISLLENEIGPRLVGLADLMRIGLSQNRNIF
jgi:DNA-binding IclR family transcriptional regulator